MEFSPGAPSPLGYTEVEESASFALYSEAASAVFLGIFYPDTQELKQEFLLQKTGAVWHGNIKPIPHGMAYAFRVDLRGKSEWVFDPLTKAPLTQTTWGFKENNSKNHDFGKEGTQSLPKETLKPLSPCAMPPPFDWEGIKKPNLSRRDLVIYEMHVRGFTQHPSSETLHPGTYLGLIEKISYLKELGISAVELLPVFEFDETQCAQVNPKTGQKLLNYWGYSPLFFFAPMRRFASDKTPFGPLQEFKLMVKELHRAGIEVILDVVYNHTGEPKNSSTYFRSIDPTTYYILDELGENIDYTGCGNTFNTAHPAVEEFILQSLRYWTDECQIDGFRFDLASVLTRGPQGNPLAPSSLIEKIGADPILRQTKLIAEPWDAAGLYQVGSFPDWGPWSEWNDRFRDITRRYIKGTDSKAGLFSSVVSGSEFLYGASKTPLSSINFITAHDGFNLRDLVTYQIKRNEENGEENKDGNHHNESWNCGVEGVTQDLKILNLREKQMRNFLLALFISQGIPMLLMGDEYGHTRGGNNNPYVQDNDQNWFLWDSLKTHNSLFLFVKGLIAFRKANQRLRYSRFLTRNDVDWHGSQPYMADWSPSSRLVAFTLKKSQALYIAFNANFHPIDITLPPECNWKQIVYTELFWSQNWLEKAEHAPTLPKTVTLAPHSALMAMQI